MAEDIIKKSGTPGEYKTDSGGGTTIPGPVLGVV
jgi:hypothetical protein